MKSGNPEHSESDLAISSPSSELASSARTSDSAETLLVVDDDSSVRELEAEILCQAGYSVLQAESAAQALRLADSAAIQLLITDFSMPEVDGLELARRFRALHPRTPVLMVSGTLRSLRDDETHGLDHVELLAKPFGLPELLHKVRMLLDAAVLIPTRKPWCCD